MYYNSIIKFVLIIQISRNAIIFGEIDGPSTQLVIPTNVDYIKALRGDKVELNGFVSQKTFKRHRTVGSNTDSQSLDSLVFMDTSLNNVIYTINPMLEIST